MAKAKKKEALSLEEKLELALVPVEEQPYELPENWCWTYLRDVAQWGSGGTPSRKNPTFYEGDIPWVKTGELEDDYLYDTEEKISDEAIQKSSAKLFPVESVLIAMYGATIGKTAILGVEATTNQACACAICNKSVYNLYLFYYLRSQKDNFIEQGKGGAQPNISQDIIKKNHIPLPPLAEQQRIVEQIESLFAKLDDVKEKLEDSLAEIDRRNDIILHNIFTGKNMSDGRSDIVEQMLEHVFSCREQMISSKEIQRAKVKPVSEEDRLNCVPKSWKQVKLGEIAFVTKLAGFEYTKYINLQEKGEVPVVRAQNVRKGYLNLKNVLYIDKKTSEMLERSALRKKSLLITFIGAGIGDVCVFDKTERYHLAPNVAKVELYGEDILNVKFILYYLLSDIGQKEIFKSMKATAQPSLSMETIRDIVVPIPEIDIQNQVVNCIDAIREKELKEKEIIENALSQVDLMKKSILAKAFRGELGTNNPDEKSSIDLLREVLKG